MIPPRRTFDIGGELFPKLAARQEGLFCQRHDFDWIDIGIISLQPSEMMKLAVPMTCAWYAHDRPLPPSFKDLCVFALIIAVPAGLIAEQPDLGTALMVLMGGEDTETPPKDCQDKLGPLQGAGAPVEMHLYPAATHCWDCVSLDGFTKTDGRGNRVLYRYDAAVTRDSETRLFDFLNRQMTPSRR